MKVNNCLLLLTGICVGAVATTITEPSKFQRPLKYQTEVFKKPIRGGTDEPYQTVDHVQLAIDYNKEARKHLTKYKKAKDEKTARTHATEAAKYYHLAANEVEKLLGFTPAGYLQVDDVSKQMLITKPLPAGV